MTDTAVLTIPQLRKAHPEEIIKSPPAKDKTTVNVSTQSNHSFMSRTPTSISFDVQSDASTDSLPHSISQAYPSKLAREKNRLTLRAYLYSLMTSSTIASSPVLRSFLLSMPTVLSQEEREDAVLREEADRMRDEGRRQFAREIADRVDGLRDAVKSVKGDIMGKGS